MNIFFLSLNIKTCARYHCNEHVIKMILEYAQLLSTAHRYLDGIECIEKTTNGRNIKRYKLNDIRDNILYKATHINHPSAIWVRESRMNYRWLFLLYLELCKEYTRRYNKRHKSEDLKHILGTYPEKLTNDTFTIPPMAMPDQYKIITSDTDKYTLLKNVTDSYRIFYIYSKVRFATYPHNYTPWWFVTN